METHQFRLLNTGQHDGFSNMGLDEAILESVAKGASLPTLRFYGWAPPAVSVGYFQGLEEEVDLVSCKLHGVDVVRRITGGGAVFHHHELTYSIIMPGTHPAALPGIQDSYRILCAGIVEGFALLGVAASFVPINDIVSADGRKLSGNAQTRRMGCVLQHGTVLLDLDAELMFDLLKVPQEKLKGKLIQDVQAHVASLRTLGLSLSFEEAADVFAQGFRRALSLDFAEEAVTPTVAEAERARVLADTKFASREWLRKR
ncbi:MAG: lipoate--protein ligase family protein [Treponema sp.]|jgi:lipoate-protein ligase A|nr:lipoate--protein ligase family protein [Treponema sp.]